MTNKPTHSPAPWLLQINDTDGECNIYTSDHIHICNVTHDVAFSSPRDTNELEANVAIIVAAPEMLFALKKAKEFYEGEVYNYKDLNSYKAICAAIAKATGNHASNGEKQ